jgi:hypothetical protein
MKVIPVLLLILLYIACKPTAKVPQPQPKPQRKDIAGTYVDKFGRTLIIPPSSAGLHYFEYYCPNLYFGYYEDPEKGNDLYPEDSADFCSPCVPAAGFWSRLEDTIFLSTYTYSNLPLVGFGAIGGRTARNGMIVRQSNKLQDSFIIQVELSQDLPQRGYLWVSISAFIDDEKYQTVPFPKVDTMPHLKSYDNTNYGYYFFRFSVDDLEKVAAHKFRFAVPKISPNYVLRKIDITYKTDYPVDFRHIDINEESREKDSFFIPIQEWRYILPYANSTHEVDILMYPTHAANWRETAFRFDTAGNIIGPYPVIYDFLAIGDTFPVYFHAPYETIYYRQK